METAMTDEKRCVGCDEIIDPRRLKTLPNTDTCTKCSNVKRVKTDMIYNDKTGGFLAVVPDKTPSTESPFDIDEEAEKLLGERDDDWR